MAAHVTVGNTPLWQRVRWLVWGGAACLLLLPLVAMQFTDEVHWTPGDFLVMGVLLGLVGAAYEVALRVARSNLYMVASGVAAGTAFITTWINLAVGIIGGENEQANMLFFGVVAVALVGAALARLQPAGMARAMLATALAQALVGAVAFATTTGHPEGYVLPAIFTAMWLASAQLFAMAGRAPPRT